MATATDDCLLITFRSTHAAIAFETAAKHAGLSMRLIPTPRTISASCGLTARLDAEQLARARELAAIHKIQLGQAYRKRGQTIRPECEEA